MQTQVQRLRDILELVKPVVPRKTTLPVLTNVLVKEGYVCASDLETYVSVEFPEASEGLLLPYQDTLAFLKTIPGHTTLVVMAVQEKEKVKVSLLAGDKRAAFYVPSVGDYPPAPQFQSKGSLSMSGDALVRGLLETVGYTASEDSRPGPDRSSTSTGG